MRRAPASLALWLGACSQNSGPPRGDEPIATRHDAAIAWHVHRVPECSYSLEVQGSMTRSQDRLPEVPDIVTYTYLPDLAEPGVKVVASCTVFPDDPSMPDDAVILAGMVRRHTVTIDGLATVGEVSSERLTVAGYPALHYIISLGAQGVLEGQVVKVGRAVHDISALHHGSPIEVDNLAHAIASYSLR